VAGDGFLPIGHMERSRETNGFLVLSGARSASGTVISKAATLFETVATVDQTSGPRNLN
jgi:hypothetical protein